MIEFCVLGTPVLRRTESTAGKALHVQPKPLALLAYLALAGPTGYCRRDTVLAVLWPDLGEAHARNALSQALHRLRRVLGREAIRSRGREELWVSPESVRCDAVSFEQALDDDDLPEALALYRGPLLDGLHVEGAPAFEHWVASERERLRRRACTAVATLTDRAEAAGSLVDGTQWLRRWLELAPDDESVLRRLLAGLDRLGDTAGMLRAYKAFARRLQYELDLSPSPETQALLQRLRARTDAHSSPTASGPSVAVLPFANLSNDPEQDYFCDGITEEIIHALTRVPGLRVAARTSVFALKRGSGDIRDLARRLGADAVLEGSVRRTDERLRITAQLINAADGYHLWSERYDRPLVDVFAIQDEIAQSIAGKLRRELRPSADESPRPTTHLEAHTLYLKGLFHRRKRTPDDLQRACAYLQQAVTLDPGYAQAHAARAYTYALGGWFIYDAVAPGLAYPLALESAATALALNDQLAEAYIAQGFTQWAYAWNWVDGEKALQQALALDPNHPNALAQYSSYLVASGRTEEAVALVSHVERLEPFWIVPKVYKGVWQLFARRYDVAIEWLRQAEALEPRLYITPFFLGDAYRFTGRLDEADAAYRRALGLMGRQPLILGRLGALRAEQNRPEEALKMVEELQALSETRYVRPATVAGIYLALGAHDEMFTWLEDAYAARDTTVALLGVSPAYDPVRSDPRFQHLLGAVGLTA